MLHEVWRALSFALVTLAIFGGAYPAAVVLVGRVTFPAQAEGSLIRRADGTVVGSRLIAQAFSDPIYIRPRPSAVDYDAAAAGGSNLGPSNPDHLQAVRQRLAAVTAGERPEGLVPSELVTTSGSGLDPDLSHGAARLQAPRVAEARGVPLAGVLGLIDGHTERPTFGVLGSPRVNVLELNLALDRQFPRTR